MAAKPASTKKAAPKVPHTAPTKPAAPKKGRGRPKVEFDAATVEKIVRVMVNKDYSLKRTLAELGFCRLTFERRMSENKKIESAIQLARKIQLYDTYDEITEISDTAFDVHSAAAAKVKIHARDMKAQRLERALYGTSVHKHQGDPDAPVHLGYVVVPAKAQAPEAELDAAAEAADADASPTLADPGIFTARRAPQ